MRRWAPLVAAFVAVLALGVVSLQASDDFVVGDEPHYVVMASSLVGDLDLDLADDYRAARLDRDIHAFHYRSGGPLAPVHGVGTSVLIAPFIAVQDSLWTGRFAMTVYAALLGAVLLSLLLAVARRWWVAVGAWAAVMATLPVVVFSFKVYPDIPGALFVAVALRALVVPEFSRRAAVVVGLCAAWLPFLHVRFGMVSLALLAAVVWRGREWWRAAAVPFAAGMAVLGLVFVYLYGSPSPGAPYDVEPFASDNTFGWVKAYRFGLGSLLGWTTGLIPFAPVFWFGVVGLAWFVRRVGPWVLLAAAGVAGLYLVVVGGHGPVVNAFPGRTMLVFVPVLAVGLVGAVEAAPVMALGVVATAVLSAGMTYQGVRHLFLLFDVGELRLSIPRRLAPAFPWFSMPPGGTELHYDVDSTTVQTPPVALRAGMYDLTVTAEGPTDVRVVRSFDQTPYGSWPATPPGSAVRFSVPDLHQFHIEASGPGRVTSLDVRPGGAGLAPVRTASSDVPLAVVWIGMTAVAAGLAARRGEEQ